MHPLDPWCVANFLLQQHGRDADLHAAMRIDALHEAGDEAGAAVWRTAIKAIDELRRAAPLPGEVRH